MTPPEFKAWLEGFSEAIDGRPTAAQWERIKEQVKRLSAGPSINVNDLYRASLDPVVAAPARPFRQIAGSSPRHPTGVSVAIPNNPDVFTCN